MTVLLIITALFVVVMDPYYHFHGPLNGMKAVLYEPEYQVIGTINNFQYDGIILGSSVAENFDNEWFDNGFGCKTIKGIKKSGTTAYLLYFLDEAYKSHELNYVFYSLDVSALLAEYKYDLEQDGMPVYLYDDNIFNDIEYIFNKDIIFEKIPYMLARSHSSDYKEGESYNWAKYKTFSEDIARSNYEEPDYAEISQELKEEYLVNIKTNVEEIENRVKQHPETEYIFWIPPYSKLWKERTERLGEMEISRYGIDYARDTLEKYQNVKFYSFLDEEEITDNLNNYMDPVHYSQDINYYIFDNICNK